MEWFMGAGIRITAVIFAAVLILFISNRYITRIVRSYVTHSMEGEEPREANRRIKTLSSILKTSVNVLVIVVVVILILPLFGVDAIAIVAGLGIGGLAISFAAQHIVADFINGFFIIFEDQYRVNDSVVIAGIEGVVEDVGLRRTVIRDSDGYVHSIPNEKVEISTNQSKNFCRVNMIITVGYGENLKRVIEIIDGVCTEIANDPQWKDRFISPPSVLRIDKLGESGIDIRIRGDTKITYEKSIMGELRLRLKTVFDSMDVEIPWPHTKIYFGNSLQRTRN